MNRNSAGELELVVPDRRALGSAFVFQFDEAIVGEFVYVLSDFRWMTIDETSELSDTRRVVLDDGFEQFEICRPEDAAEGCETLDAQSGWIGIYAVTSVDSPERVFEAIAFWTSSNRDAKCSSQEWKDPSECQGAAAPILSLDPANGISISSPS
nr:hypothetical protein [Halomicroarcula laminariae]